MEVKVHMEGVELQQVLLDTTQLALVAMATTKQPHPHTRFNSLCVLA